MTLVFYTVNADKLKKFAEIAPKLGYEKPITGPYELKNFLETMGFVQYYSRHRPPRFRFLDNAYKTLTEEVEIRKNSEKTTKEYIELANYLGLKLDKNMVLEDIKFIILNTLQNKFDGLNLEITYDEFLKKYDLVDIVTDSLAKVEDYVDFLTTLEAEQEDLNEKKTRLEEIAEQRRKLDEEEQAILNTPASPISKPTKEERQKKFEEKINKESQLMDQLNKQRKEEITQEIATLKIRKDNKIRKVQVENSLDEETALIYMKNKDIQLMEQDPETFHNKVYLIKNIEDFETFWTVFMKTKVYDSDSNQKDITEYYVRRLTSNLDEIVNMITNVINSVYNRLKTSFKYNFYFSGILEMSHMKDDKTIYEYEHVDYNFKFEDRNVPIIPPHELMTGLDTDIDSKIKFLVETIIKELISRNHGKSSKHLVCLTGVTIKIYKLNALTGGKIMLPDVITKNKNIVPYPFDNDLCFWAAIWDEFENKTHERLDKCSKEIKNYVCDYYGIVDLQINNKHKSSTPTKRNEFSKNYKGFDFPVEITEYCAKTNTWVFVYEYNKTTKTFTRLEEHGIGNARSIHLLIHTAHLQGSQETKSHVMRVKDCERLTGFRYCPICHYYMVRTDDHNAERNMNIHKRDCKGYGKNKSDIILPDIQRPYLPHLKSQKLLAYLVGKGLTNILGQPITPQQVKYLTVNSYITYDFETMENKLDEQAGNSTVIKASLHPLSVAWTVRTNEIKTYYIDMRSSPSNDPEYFVKEFMRQLWVCAQEVKDYETKRFEEYYKDIIPDEQLRYKLYKCKLEKVSVYGYNSARFDSQFIAKFWNKNDNRPRGKPIASSSAFKSVTISNKNHPNLLLVMKDAMHLVSAMPLKDFAENFGNVKLGAKGTFPYEKLTLKTYKQFLDTDKALPISAFFSNLTNKKCSDDEYLAYINDIKTMKNHWEYLEYYNRQDTRIMVPAIDFWINTLKPLGINLVNFMSISSFASSLKYALAYKDFDINKHYPNKPSGKPFKLTREHWAKKVANYKAQDEKKQRDTTDNVNEADYTVVKNWFENSECYICKGRFDYVNYRPTLDRLNNELGHSLSNCKPCCEFCNCTKSDNDEVDMTVKIQLRNYALLNGLPFALGKGDEKAYEILRGGVVGGLSNVLNRVNIAGESKVVKFGFDKSKYDVTYRKTDNVVKQIVGLDFNSLYPSAFASVKHPCIPYTGGVMYMAGRLEEYYEVTTEQQRQMALKLINDKNDLFVVVVKGSIPASKRDYCANLPPIFRSIDITTHREAR